MVALLFAAACLALIELAWAVHRIRFRALARKDRRRRIAEWTDMARSRGFEVEAREDDVVIRGTVASRPFVLDSMNFFAYGMDTENALRFHVEDEDAIFSITGWDVGYPHGLQQPPVGDEAFDARHKVRANTPGLRWIARLGPDERKLLVDFPELDVLQGGGEVRIRLPYRIDLAHLDAACRLVESFWCRQDAEEIEK